MDFGFNDEYKMIQKMYREFAEKEIKPLAEEIDENERFPKESVQKMADNGMLGIPFPEEYGGEEGDYLSYVIAVEELSKVCASTGVTLSAHTSLGSAPIYDWGTEEQKQKYLTRLASGECLGAFGLTEPNAGTDASRQKTTAVKKGDHYVLNGSKCFITNAGEAEIYVVMAMTDKEKGNHGISAFIVEDGFEGFSIGKHEKKMGIRGSATASLVFEDCIVPAENLLGEEGQGFKVAMHTLDGGRIGIAAQALGIAEGALNEAIAYSNYLIKECQRQGFTPNTTFRCYDTPMAMQLVQAGFGVSYLPRSIVETQPHLGLYTKPIQGISVLSYPTLVWSSNLYYASCVKRFLAMFEGEDAEK